LAVYLPLLKNISQLGLLFPIYGKIKNVSNHQPVKYSRWLIKMPRIVRELKRTTLPTQMPQPELQFGMVNDNTASMEKG